MAGITWEAPGPGAWTTDRSHNDRPATGYLLGSGNSAMREAMAEGFAMVGVAIGPFRGAVVNGWTYSQQTWADASTYADLELAAKDFLANRRWVERVATWENVRRPQRLAECTTLQAVDPTALSDSALVAHIDDCVEGQRRGSRIHFEQHGLCVIIGELVLACREWGLAETDVLPLLDGHSAASSRAGEMIAAIAEALVKTGVRPSTLAQVRGASADAAAALDAYLDLHGSLPVAGFDFDARTLNEMPEVVIASITAAMDRAASPRTAAAPLTVDEVRARVPANDRTRFDDLLASARMVYGVRDDDVHFSMWCRGLSRRALLEVGRRLEARGQLEGLDHVLELTPDEITALLVARAATPTASDVADRVARREQHARLAAPPHLGDAPAPPPFDAMPPTVRRMTEAMIAYTQLRRTSRRDVEPLTGAGIGAAVYRGRAVVASNADDAFDRIEPGDVLVTVLTTPAFNAVLPLCGALVVEDAGVLSHAAVTARELGLPAVVGVAQVTTLVPDGAQVEVDPVAGRVRVL
jgi:pyruvate,water dikinase